MGEAAARELAAFCAVHPQAAAAGSCTRCGAFYCAEDQIVLEAGGFCASCGARPDVDHLEAFRLKFWGQRDGWVRLSALWFCGQVLTAIAGARADNMILLLLGVVGAGVSAGYFLLLPWARVGLVLFNALAITVAMGISPADGLRNVIPLLVSFSLLANTRNRLAFRQPVTREALAKAWDLYANNTIARTGFLLAWLGLAVPGVGVVAACCGWVGLSRVDPHAMPPIGRKKMALAAIVLGALATVGWLVIGFVAFRPR